MKSDSDEQCMACCYSSPSIPMHGSFGPHSSEFVVHMSIASSLIFSLKPSIDCPQSSAVKLVGVITSSLSPLPSDGPTNNFAFGSRMSHLKIQVSQRIITFAFITALCFLLSMRPLPRGGRTSGVHASLGGCSGATSCSVKIAAIDSLPKRFSINSRNFSSLNVW